MNIHRIINNKENRVHHTDVIHFQPFTDRHDVRCLNGSFHAKRTVDISKVTCSKCLNPETGQGFWSRHEHKKGNANKVFPNQ